MTARSSSTVQHLLYIELSNSFRFGRKRTVNFRNQHPWRHNGRLYNKTIIMSRTLKVTGNHVKFARFVLLPVSEEAKTWLPFLFAQFIIKQLLDSVFVISRIIKVSVRVISFQPRSQGLSQLQPSADNPYLDLDYSVYSGNHKNLIQKLFTIFLQARTMMEENTTVERHRGNGRWPLNGCLFTLNIQVTSLVDFLLNIGTL